MLSDRPTGDRKTGEPQAPLKDLAKKAGKARLEALRTAGQLSTVGMSFAFAILIGVLIGVWLDRVTGWRPVFFIAFFLLGLAAGILNVVRLTTRFFK